MFCNVHSLHDYTAYNLKGHPTFALIANESCYLFLIVTKLMVRLEITFFCCKRRPVSTWYVIMVARVYAYMAPSI